MAAVDLEVFEPHIRPWVRRCPHDMIVLVIRTVLREFCQFTRCWQYVPAAQTIADATASYTLLLEGAYAEPVAVEWMTVDEAVCTHKTVEWLDQNIPTWRTRVADDFQYFTQLRPTTVTFAAVPDNAGTTGGWMYRISQKPTMAATTTEERLFNDYADEISEGAKGVLMAMPGQNWTDLKQAAAHTLAYTQKKKRVRIRVQQNFGHADQNWQSPYKFAGR